MEPRLATRTLSASTEIAKAALSADDPAAERALVERFLGSSYAGAGKGT